MSYKELEEARERVFVPGLVRGKELTIADKLKVVSRVCNRLPPTHAYILSIGDGSDIKFGITNRPVQRIKQLRFNNKITVKVIGVYAFANADSVLAAELECKRSLICKTANIQDGASETTYSSNTNAVVEIYKKHGGVLTKLKP